MSYNCDNVSYIGEGRLSVTLENVHAMIELAGEDYPEVNFLEDMPEEGGELESLCWCSEGSGYSFQSVFLKLLELTTGSADLVLQWEHGDSVSGLRVVDGKVTQHKVTFVLGELA